MVKRLVLFTAFTLFSVFYAGVSVFADDSLLNTGIAEFKRGRVEQASSTFQVSSKGLNLKHIMQKHIIGL